MSRELSPKDIVSLWKVYRRVVREKPDIIHTHTAKAGTIGRAAGFLYRWLTWKTLLGKPRRVKCVHTYHGHVFHSYYGNLKTKIFLFIEKFLALLATDKIVVITRQQFDEIHGKFGVGRAKQFEIIPLGIDLAPFANPSEIGAGADEILVGFVGRLTEIKNVPLLLKVAAFYRERKNTDSPNLKFVIIGDGNLRAELEKEAESLNLQGIVKFIGNREDADVFYAGLDIVALVSLNEGTPLSVIEAMANERAVISTSVGGVADLLGEAQAEKDGFIVCERGIRTESGDAEGFYNGLMFLAQETALRADASAAGKRFVQENYSKERLVGDIRRLYEGLQNS
jgi:glycosyltransferase involved in cell wall biosynthesis